jgi:hypothetical protein
MVRSELAAESSTQFDQRPAKKFYRLAGKRILAQPQELNACYAL